MIRTAIAILASILRPGSRSGAVSSVVGVASVAGAVIGAVAWLFGPGRELQVCLNALELCAIAFAGGAVVLLALWARSPQDVG